MLLVLGAISSITPPYEFKLKSLKRFCFLEVKVVQFKIPYLLNSYLFLFVHQSYSFSLIFPKLLNVFDLKSTNKPASLVAQMVKCLPAMRETQVQSLGWEDLLEKEMATHSSTLAWRIPRTEEPGRLQSMGLQRVRHDWATSLSLFFFQ